MAAIFTTKIGQIEAATYSQINYSTMEIDNHADTTALGSNFLHVHYFDRLLDISGWDVRYGSVEFTTISGYIAYDRPISGKFYLSVYH